MITTHQMIALRSPRSTTLAFRAARQLFETAMQFFDLPAHVVRSLSSLRRHGLSQITGDDPVYVAVRSDYLEQPTLKGTSFN